MRHYRLLPALLLMISALMSAAEGMPAGLPYERVELRDGRTLTGHYDEAQGILWLDGVGSPRLRVAPDDIAKRSPVVVAEKEKGKDKKARASAENSVPLPTTPPSAESLQQTVATLERQLADLDRKMAETRAALIKINAHFQEWLKVYAKAKKVAEADPGTGIGFENNASYNLTKILSEIKGVRDQLTRQEDALARQTERRQELLANLREANQALSQAKTNTPTVTVYTLPAAAPAAPPANAQMEQRIAALEAELRTMRETNERLLRLLEALAPPKPQPPQPSVTEPTAEPVDGLVAVLP
ncbi:MAG: hypothetical protein H0W78_09780 [Planctomycetes bacterium]|nr:hypothetical protein [Planctomycetota bacterium]